MKEVICITPVDILKGAAGQTGLGISVLDAFERNGIEPHVRRAIEELDLPGLSLRRARKGRDWLDEHGPTD